MRGKRAWAFCISFPDTLDQLYELLQNDEYVDLIDQHIDIMHYGWYVPDQAKEEDYIIYIVTPGNTKHIIKLINELKEYPEEWSIEDFDNLSSVLEDAKEDYMQYDGKLYCVAEIKEIFEDGNRKYVRYGSNWLPNSIIRCYDNSIVRADRGMRGLQLSYLQTLEIIESAVSRNQYTEYLFNLNVGIAEPSAIDYGNQVQAFVVNNAFNKSLDEILQNIKDRGYLTIEVLLNEQEIEWTAPRWCKPGDIALFMFSKTSNAILSALTTEFNKTESSYTLREKRLLKAALCRGKELYNKYGGCIFAFARVDGRISFEKHDSESFSHWRSPIYAPMNHVTILEKPISIEVFREFLTISRQQTITPVLGDTFDRLKDLIVSNNSVPDFFKYLKATPMPLQKVNDGNWIAYGMEYRRHFFLETAFRKYYVDYLLRELGDKKTFFYECKCYKSSGNPPRVDNIILFLGKYLPVEIKLSIHNEANIENQVHQYCQLSYVDLGKRKIIQNPLQQMWYTNVLIIDTEDVYIYDDKTSVVKKIFNLDRLTDMRKIQDLRDAIASFLPQE